MINQYLPLLISIDSLTMIIEHHHRQSLGPWYAAGCEWRQKRSQIRQRVADKVRRTLYLVGIENDSSLSKENIYMLYHTHIHIYICNIYTHPYIYIHIHIYIYTSIYIYMYMYKHIVYTSCVYINIVFVNISTFVAIKMCSWIASEESMDPRRAKQLFETLTVSKEWVHWDGFSILTIIFYGIIKFCDC